jgi:hypothetical protein
LVVPINGLTSSTGACPYRGRVIRKSESRVWRMERGDIKGDEVERLRGVTPSFLI